MHNLFPFSHCNATSLGFTEHKYKQGIVELSQLNLYCNSATSFFQIWLCGKKKPSNFKSKKKYMTIKFVSNGKINAKGFKALLTGESMSHLKYQTKNKNSIQYLFSAKVFREIKAEKEQWTSVSTPPLLSSSSAQSYTDSSVLLKKFKYFSSTR